MVLDHLLWARPINEVVVERPTFRAESISIACGFAEVEPSAPGVVEKNSVTAGFMNGQEKRNAFVERINRLLRPHIGIPQCVGLASAIESASLISQPKEMFAAQHRLVHGEST